MSPRPRIKPPARRVAEPLIVGPGNRVHLPVLRPAPRANSGGEERHEEFLALPRSLVEKACEAMEKADDEREWLAAMLDEQTCADLCDKTFEQQGCPSGTCARESGQHAFNETSAALRAVLAELRGYVGGK